MRVAHLLSGTALVSMFALLMPGASLASPSINIDESAEGGLPTVTGNGITLSNVTVTPVTGVAGEEWTISFKLPSIQNIGSIIGGEGGGLKEPGTLKLSDALPKGQVLSGGEGFVKFQFSLFSDDEAGNIASSCFGCVTTLEDGTFQSMSLSLTTFFQNTDHSVPIFLKSDADAVPEPGSLALLGGGIGALWLLRRRRRLA